MKSISKIFGMFFLLSLSLSLFAQTKGFNYQAVARDAEQNPLANTYLSVYFSLFDQSNSLIWKEVHFTSTDDLGMFNLVILHSTDNWMEGTANTPEEIVWSEPNLFLEVELDAGNGIVSLGSSPLLAVPYAQYALNGTPGPIGPQGEPGAQGPQGDPASDDQTLILEGNDLSISGGNTVDIASYIESNTGWVKLGEEVIYKGGNVGVGTNNPEGRLSIQGIDESDEEALFMVTRKDGYPVFAVYEHGVYAFTDSVESAKGIKGGFAVGGYNKKVKGIGEEYMRITPDSIRFWVHEDPDGAKGIKSGFAVGGYNKKVKNESFDLLRVSPDSVRIYIDDEADSKGIKSGFAVGGYNKRVKGTGSEYFNISTSQSGHIVNDESRIVWYPQKDAFLTGTVHIGDVDSVGTNSAAIGYKNIAMGQYSQAFGYQSQAIGNYSMAVGKEAIAAAEETYAFGNGSRAQNTGSFALGFDAIASGADAFAIGSGTRAQGTGSFALGFIGRDSSDNSTGNTSAESDYAVAIGMGAKSTNKGAFSIGTLTEASGRYSSAIGYQSISENYYSISIGYKSKAAGIYALALGPIATSSGLSSIALGYNSLSNNNYSIAIGLNCIASGNQAVSIGQESSSTGFLSFALGSHSVSSAQESYSMGSSSEASGLRSLALGYQSKASASYSTAIGYGAEALGENSCAIGYSSKAEGDKSVSFQSSDALGGMSFSSGYGAVSSGFVSFAAGFSTLASGDYSFSCGTNAKAYGYASFAGGAYTIAQSDGSFAAGGSTKALGQYSTALGLGNTAVPFCSFVVGRYNDTSATTYSRDSWIENEPLFIVGNGEWNNTHNAMQINKNGEIYFPDAYEDDVEISIRDLYIDSNGKIGYMSSSRRYKKKINDLNNINWLYKLRPVSFLYKEDASKTLQTGLIAEEVAEINSSLVSYDKEGRIETVSYHQLVTPMLKALQEQHKLIDEKDAEIRELKNRLRKIEEHLGIQ